MGYRVTLLIIALIVIILYANEGFTDRKSKAKAIFDWFSGHANPTYAQFRHDLDSQSNIVEYEDVLRLSHKRNLTLADVESAI